MPRSHTNAQGLAGRLTILTASLLFSCDAPQSPAPSVELLSAQGLDYRPLATLLQQGNWQAADRETFQLMLLATDRQTEGWLRQVDIETFPCTDLNTLAQLWQTHSDGQFGFWRQQTIWEAVGGIAGHYEAPIAEALGETVGWRQQKTWLTYDELTFQQQAPAGHLPATIGNGVSGGVWGGVGAIAGRLKYCPLMDALAEQQWDTADRATLRILSNLYLEPQADPRDPMILNLATLPCHDLIAIDRLWKRYSNEQFGFSVQTSILQATGNEPTQAVHWGHYEAFEAAVGWDNLQIHESGYDGVAAAELPQGYFPARLGYSFATYGSGFKRTWRLQLNPTCDL